MSARLQSRHTPDAVIIALVCAAQFMVVLDVSIVNVALPSIGRELHYSPTGLQWVVNAYTLTFAGFLLLGGRIADLYGRRRVFIAGLVLFSLASLLGGLAQTSAQLTAARAAQGIGAAVLSPATLTIIMTTFSEGAARHRALGAWSAVAGAGGAFGAIIGGLLTSSLSWRWVLFVNVPIGIVVGAVAVLMLTEAHGHSPQRSLDLAGSVTATGGLALLVWAIVGTTSHPWGSTRTVVLLVVAVALLALFVLIQGRLARAPLMPLSLFRSRSVSGANGVMLLAGIPFFSMWYFVSLYLQDVHRFSPLTTGLLFLPMSFGVISGAQASSRVIGRFGARNVLVVGLAVGAGGFVWLSRLTAESSYVAGVLGGGLMATLGVGLAMTPLATAATTGVPNAQAGLASGVLNTARQVGGAVGLAALATLATDRTLAAAHRTGRAAALTAGYDRAFLASAVVAGAAAVLAAISIPAHRRPADVGATAPEVGAPAPVPSYAEADDHA